MDKFKLVSSFKPSGDQEKAISFLTSGINSGFRDQVLLGVTGSGKTFTMANVIKNIQKPTLIISHNKTLAGQLCQEFRDFFPENAVEYFVSYYDYYQPESYIPQRDQYIAKEVDINKEIDKLRLSTTASLMTRKDVIVVASVSCIYNLGSPEEYGKAVLVIDPTNSRSSLTQEDIMRRLIELFYERSDFDFARSSFRVRGEYLDIWPSYTDAALRLFFSEDGTLSKVFNLSPISGEVIGTTEKLVIYPAKHYVTNRDNYNDVLSMIRNDLASRVAELKREGKDLEAHRIEQRTKYDLEMIAEIGYCQGIENYSRYFERRLPGEPAFTLLDYFPKDFLLFIDESHITVPQISGMYNGDRSRKQTLIDYGFRLPSAIDNRPLKFSEFLKKINQTIYVSATPDKWEIERSGERLIEQLVRPTGLLDPEIVIKPTKGQVADLLLEIEKRTKKKERVLVTTLTKRMAEDLAEFLKEKEIKVTYLHADVKTLERSDILDDLRKGEYDVLVGINLLREGLDLPEVSLVAVLDADREGFLRSEVSLIQTMGRAARHINGKVILYADKITGSMERAILEVTRRRKVQAEWNKINHITPKGITKPLRERLIAAEPEEGRVNLDLILDEKRYLELSVKERKIYLEFLEKEMEEAASQLNFEKAAEFRDYIRKTKGFSRYG